MFHDDARFFPRIKKNAGLGLLLVPSWDLPFVWLSRFVCFAQRFQLHSGFAMDGFPDYSL